MLAGRQIRERRRHFHTIGRIPKHRLADVRAAPVRQLGTCAAGVDEPNEPEPAHYERDQSDVHPDHGVSSSPRPRAASGPPSARVNTPLHWRALTRSLAALKGCWTGRGSGGSHIINV